MRRIAWFANSQHCRRGARKLLLMVYDLFRSVAYINWILLSFKLFLVVGILQVQELIESEVYYTAVIVHWWCTPHEILYIMSATITTSQKIVLQFGLSGPFSLETQPSFYGSSKQQRPSLFTLPPEILALILSHLLLPNSPNLYMDSCNLNPLLALRLTNTFFSSHPYIFNLTFNHLLTTWLNEKESHRKVSILGAQTCYCIHGGKWNVWGMEGVANEDCIDDVDVRKRIDREEKVFGGIVNRLIEERRCHDDKDVYEERKVNMGIRRLRLYRMLGRMEEW